MRTRPAILVLVLAAVLLGGCSRGGTETATTTTSPTTTESIAQTAPPEASATVETTITGDAKKRIMDILKASPNLSTMTKLVQDAGITAALAGGKTNTLFVPTDAAFQKLPEGTLAKLQDPANKEKLRQLVRYHLVMGKVPASQMVNIKRVLTYQGGILMAAGSETSMTISGVKVTQTDVPASNGFIDVVDTVLVPKGFAP